MARKRSRVSPLPGRATFSLLTSYRGPVCDFGAAMIREPPVVWDFPIFGPAGLVGRVAGQWVCFAVLKLAHIGILSAGLVIAAIAWYACHALRHADPLPEINTRLAADNGSRVRARAPLGMRHEVQQPRFKSRCVIWAGGG